MTGPFQHHIPQMLQRGFRIPGGSRKSSKIWVYERGVDARTERVKDIGGEDYFYSEPSTDGQKTLDEHLTEYETSFDKLLSGLKQTEPGVAVDSRQAAEVVAHLTIRNAYLRLTFGLGVEKLYSDAAVLFSDEANLRPIMGVDDKFPSAQFREAIDDFIEKSPEFKQLGLPKAVLYRVGHMLMKEQFNRFFSEQVPQMIAALGGAATLAPEIARDSHNKILAEGLAPDRRVRELESLEWSIQSPSEGTLILPDCVALGLDDEPGFKSVLLSNLGMAKVVLLPLSSAKMLVGIRQGEKMPDLALFNQAAAACSNEFFIANCESGELKKLQCLIATATTKFVEEAFGSAITEFSKKGMEGLVEPVNHGVVEKGDQVGLVLPSYSVHFLGCADEETAQRIAAVLKSITNELGKVIPLGRLDGVTFAHDYEAALRDLDRGFEAPRPLASTPLDYGVGVSTAPTVMRDGVVKTHIVMRGDIGHGLLSEEESQWRFAYHLVIGQLAAVTNQEVFDQLLPGLVGKPIEAHYAAFLYPQVDAAWGAYYSARISASFYPQGEDGYGELLVSAIQAAQADIPAARYDYRFHGDLDRFLAVVLPRIRNILWFSGKVLGHYDGLAQPLFSDEKLARALETAQLTNWFVLFDSELSELWSRQGKWASFDEFLHLNRHVERLLWSFAIFPWTNEEGQIQIEIPLQSDVHSLSTESRRSR
jgi:hypothetical protein